MKEVSVWGSVTYGELDSRVYQTRIEMPAGSHPWLGQSFISIENGRVSLNMDYQYHKGRDTYSRRGPKMSMPADFFFNQLNKAMESYFAERGDAM